MGAEALFAGEGGVCSLTEGLCFTLQRASRLLSLAGVGGGAPALRRAITGLAGASAWV